jgi:hypothetical protein
MRYMMLIYSREGEDATPEQRAAVYAGHLAVMEDARRKGVFRGADPLEGSASATTVRVKDGQVMITDGPFAETKEQLAGYYILDCENLDEAMVWAARIPSGCLGGSGCIEIRPLRAIAAPPAPVNG